MTTNTESVEDILRPLVERKDPYYGGVNVLDRRFDALRCPGQPRGELVSIHDAHCCNLTNLRTDLGAIIATAAANGPLVLSHVLMAIEQALHLGEDPKLRAAKVLRAAVISDDAR